MGTGSPAAGQRSLGCCKSCCGTCSCAGGPLLCRRGARPVAGLVLWCYVIPESRPEERADDVALRSRVRGGERAGLPMIAGSEE
eukprot:16352454-Heterocapsa_arctica.AAC.1